MILSLLNNSYFFHNLPSKFSVDGEVLNVRIRDEGDRIKYNVLTPLLNHVFFH